MKKNILIMVVLLSFGCINCTFAAQDALSTGSSLTITDGGTAGVDLLFGLSPKVVVRYINPGTSDNTAQWYSIGAVHPGGTRAYGTTQDLNNMYIKTYGTGSTINNAVLDIPTNSVSAANWNAGWSI